MTSIDQIMDLSMSEYKALLRGAMHRQIDDLIAFVDRAALQRVILMTDKPKQSDIDGILAIDRRRQEVDDLFDEKKKAKMAAKHAAMISQYLKARGGEKND